MTLFSRILRRVLITITGLCLVSSGLADTWESGWEAVTVGTRRSPTKLEITRISTEGVGETTRVIVDYRYRDDRNSQLSVSLHAAGNNGAQHIDVPVATLSGDLLVDAQVEWQSGQIVWAAGLDWPDQYSTALKLKLVADDRMFLIVDLSAGPEARFYPVISLNAPPKDLTVNRDYMTRKLLLRRVSKGSYTMGTAENKSAANHRVVLTRDFYVGVFEVTQKQWQLVVGSEPSVHSGEWRPVENVTWNDVRGGRWPNGAPAMSSFMGRLRARTGMDFDLLTEGQWEYACRANASNDFNMPPPDGAPNTQDGGESDSKLEPLGWYAANSLSARHREVGRKIPNRWGLYDMHGNVYEWCLDWYGHYGGDAVDPVGSSVAMFRVYRGGSWFDHARHATSWARQSADPDHKSQDLGLRVGLIPQW